MLCSCYLWQSGGPVGSLSIGRQGSVQNRTGDADRVERSNLIRTSFQLVSTNVCSDHNREDNVSERLIGGELFPSPTVSNWLYFLSSFFLSFLRFTVSFSQKRGFPLKAGGSPAILTVKTWQYLLKYGCGVRFAFCCYLHRHFALRVFSFALSLHHKTRSHSPKHRRGESEWITRSRSPEHRSGESEWIGLRLMDSSVFSSTSLSAYFGDLHASTSVYHDVYTGGSLLHIM